MSIKIHQKNSKMKQNTRVLLSSRPQGMADESNFKMDTQEIPALKEGQFLVANEYISIDPAIRGWMNAGTTYIPGIEIGAVIRAFAAGKVVASLHPAFPVGCRVEGLLGAQSHAVSDGQNIHLITDQTHPVSWYLGVLGMPGMTAYFGLLDKGQPRAGETVVVSGAAGMIGTLVGQIAKLKGCRVVGIAGGQTKCDYLVEEMGFDVAVDYKKGQVAEDLQKTCPEGMHIYFDNVGGQILDDALLNLARGARVVICGAISQYNDMANIQGPKNYMKILTARGLLTGIIVFDYFHRYPEAIAELSSWIAQGLIKNKEQIIEGIAHFPKALQMLFTGENLGKLLIKV